MAVSNYRSNVQRVVPLEKPLGINSFLQSRVECRGTGVVFLQRSRMNPGKRDLLFRGVFLTPEQGHPELKCIGHQAPKTNPRVLCPAVCCAPSLDRPQVRVWPHG